MKRNFVLITIVSCSTFLFGVVLVNAYQYMPNLILPSQTDTEKTFNLADPESVLPIRYQEEFLTDPKADEKNPEYFDPEGRYFFLDRQKPFKEIYIISILGKDQEPGPENTLAHNPQGLIWLNDTDLGSTDNCDIHDYLEIPRIEIKDGAISFTSETKLGVSFEFRGKFLIKGNFYTLDLNSEVIKGTLSKRRNGKIIASKETIFGWDPGETCLH